MAVERKPRVDPLVPTRAIDFHLGRVHVGTPDQEVAREIEAAIDKAAAREPRWTPAIRRQAVQYAIWRHHQDLAEYRRVMGGGHGIITTAGHARTRTDVRWEQVHAAERAGHPIAHPRAFVFGGH
ncbi:MAG: hypothetical protein ABSH07_12005 [Candidatus Dormibacteria bacterium]|jgi:hypothetical protein